MPAITDRDELSVMKDEPDMAYSALFPLFPRGFYGFNEADVDTGGGHELHVNETNMQVAARRPVDNISIGVWLVWTKHVPAT